MEKTAAIQMVLAKTVILTPSVVPGTYKRVEPGYRCGDQVANEPSYSVIINGKERLVTVDDFNATYESENGNCMKIAAQRMIPTQEFKDEQFREAFNSLIADSSKWNVGQQFVTTPENPQDWTSRAVIAYSAKLINGEWTIIRVYPISKDSVRRNYPYDWTRILN